MATDLERAQTDAWTQIARFFESLKKLVDAGKDAIEKNEGLGRK